MSWGTPYGEDYGEDYGEGSQWAADWAQQLSPPAANPHSPWWSSPYAYIPTYGQKFQYQPRMTTGSEPYRPVSTYTQQILDQMIDEYSRKTYPELYGPPRVSGPTTATPMASPGDPFWLPINKWDPFIHQYTTQVAQETGVVVPGNVVKAIMAIESRGDPHARNGAAVGPLQVTPDAIGATASENGWDYRQALNDPNYALYAGIKELALRYLDARKQNMQYGWSNVANGYFSNSYEIVDRADSTGTSVDEYNKRFTDYLGQLDQQSAPQPGNGGYSAPQGTSEFTAIWGGTDVPVTQEFGPTDFAAAHANDMYKYAQAYNVTGHPGVDVGVEEGTRLYSPVSGKVTIAGGTPYYTDSKMTPAGATSQNGTGELMIQLDNGDQIILGHMNQIGVQVGDTIQAGQLVGTSGYNNGAHVHVEYRHLDPTWNGNPEHMVIIDPRNALAGTYSGQFLGPDQPGYGGSTVPSGTNWQDILAATAQGRPIALGENAYQPTGTFRDYVLQAMGIYKPQQPTQMSPQGNTQFAGGSLSQAGQTSFGDWSTLDQQNANIDAAVRKVQQQTGIAVPANLIKGVMAREGSFGADWVPGGQTMKTRPGEMIEPWNGLTRGAVISYPGLDWRKVVTDQAYSIYAQAYIMATLYKQYSNYGWDGTMTAYLTGSPTRSSDPEGLTKTSDYLYGPNGVLNHWHRLDQLAAQKQQQQ